MSETNKAAGEKPAADAKAEDPAKALKAENKELKRTVEELTEQLQVKEATAGSKLPTVKVDGGNYIFAIGRFRVKGRGIVTAEDAAKDSSLCAELVAKKSGVLTPVELKKTK